jgi:hypothetical protein
LRAELLLKGTVIHERLVGEYGFTGNYQRVKMYLDFCIFFGHRPGEHGRADARSDARWGCDGVVVVGVSW